MHTFIGFKFVDQRPGVEDSDRQILENVMKYFGFENNEEYINAYPGHIDPRQSKIGGIIWKNCSLYCDDPPPNDLFTFGFFVVFFDRSDDCSAVQEIHHWWKNHIEGYDDEAIATIPITTKEVINALSEDEHWKTPEEKDLWFCEDWKE